MLDSYILLNRQPKNIIKLFTFSIFLLFFILIFLINKLTYTPYLEKKSKVVFMNNNFYLEVEILQDEFNTISNNNKIIINNKEYFYNIDKINLDDSSDSRQKIYLYIENLSNSYKINNYILLVKFEKETKGVIDSLIGGNL